MNWTRIRCWAVRLVALIVVAAAAVIGPLPKAVAADKMKVALILPSRINDPGYYNAGYLALLATKAKFGAEISYQESLTAANAERVLRAYGDDGIHYVIVMGGGNYDDQIKSVSKDYPGLKFIIVSGGFSTPPGIVSIRTGNPGVAYMAGILMAEVSKSGKLGLIGGRATPPAIADHAAIIAGARSVRPNVEILLTYTENYENPTLGKEAAIAQIEQGADILFTNANTTSFGVFQAAKERNVLAVGAATDQNEVAPGNVLTSTVYGMDNGILYLIDLDRSGKGWEPKVYTMDLTLVDLAPFHSLDSKVSAATRQKITDARNSIIAGAIKVPTTFEQVNFTPPKK